MSLFKANISKILLKEYNPSQLFYPSVKKTLIQTSAYITKSSPSLTLYRYPSKVPLFTSFFTKRENKACTTTKRYPHITKTRTLQLELLIAKSSIHNKMNLTKPLFETYPLITRLVATSRSSYET